MADNPKQPNLFQTLKRLGTLYVDNIRYTAAEKFTLLLSGIAIFSIVMVLAVLALIFIAIGIGNMLETYLEPFWTYFIIAGLLLLVIVAVILLKDRLLVDPIARFISKLFIDTPAETPKPTKDENN